MGTGGGGEEEWVRPMISEVHEKGKRLTLVEPNEVPSDESAVIVSRAVRGLPIVVRARSGCVSPPRKRWSSASPPCGVSAGRASASRSTPG